MKTTLILYVLIVLAVLGGCVPEQQTAPPGPPSLQLVPAQYYSTYYVPIRKRGKVVGVERRTVRVVVEPDNKPPRVEAVEDSETTRRQEAIKWYGDYLADEIDKLRKEVGKRER